MPLHCPVCACHHQEPNAWQARNDAMADTLKAWPDRSTSVTRRAVHAVADGRTRCGYAITDRWHTVPSDSLVECDQCLRGEAPTRIRASQTNTAYRARRPDEYRRWRAAQTTTTVVAALAGDPVEAARALRRLGADRPGIEATITALFDTEDIP